MEEKDFLILVDEKDQAWGKLEKQLVHEKGLLHRAFSVFVFNSKGEMLLQQRADHKYHSGGLWTNACCSHPRYGEALQDAVQRRMFEEIGLQSESKHIFQFQYRAEFENGLIEHELDHVFVSVTDDTPTANPDEVKDFKYVLPEKVQDELRANPEQFTVWFRICFDRVLQYYHNLSSPLIPQL
jgi:isopentenyl-diphosphate Delta-isomerase